MAFLEPMYALESGKQHDIFLLSKSGIWNKLWVYIPYEAPEDYKTAIHGLNSDPVIPQSISDVLGYENPADGTVHSLRILQLQKFVSDVEEFEVNEQYHLQDFHSLEHQRLTEE